MKMILLHGEDYLSSLKRLNLFINEAKKRKWGIKRIEANNIKNISSVFTDNSLFSDTNLYIIENIKAIEKKDLKWIKDNAINIDKTVVFYNKNPISGTFMNLLPKEVVIEEYNPPKIIFDFLSSLYPGNAKSSFDLLDQLVKQKSYEFIFVMISRHFRDLYWVTSDPSKIPYPSWKVLKLEQQAGKFTKIKIQNIIDKLARIDTKVKTSNSTLDSELSLLMIEELS